MWPAIESAFQPAMNSASEPTGRKPAAWKVRTLRALPGDCWAHTTESGTR